MKTLALEFSSERRSVALLEGQDVRGRAEQVGGRNAHPFALIQSALQEAGWEREEVAVVAVGLGPGSYAGIRTALSIAQGWQAARSVRLLGISSVEALAHQAGRAGMTGLVHFLIDAQRQEFYFASYQLEAGSRRVAHPLRLATPAEVEPHLASGRVIVPPDLHARFLQGHVMLPGADAVGALAEGRTDFARGNQLEPIYLRPTSFLKAPPPRAIPAL